MQILVEQNSTANWLDSLKQFHEIFLYDWDNEETEEPSRNLFPKAKDFATACLSKITEKQLSEELSTKTKEMLGEFLYRVAAFCCHVERNPDIALQYLRPAAEIAETNLEIKAEIQNHLSYAYQQLLARTNQDKNNDLIVSYSNQAKKYCDTNALLHDTKPTKITAFAWCLKALIEYELRDLESSVASYSQAITYYEENNLKNLQWARAKTRWAMILDETIIKDPKNEKNFEKLGFSHPNAIFQEIKTYWENQPNYMAHYFAGRFFEELGKHFLIYEKKYQDALESYKTARTIFIAKKGEDAAEIKKITATMTTLENNLKSSPTMYSLPSSPTSKQEAQESTPKAEQTEDTPSFSVITPQ